MNKYKVTLKQTEEYVIVVYAASELEAINDSTKIMECGAVAQYHNDSYCDASAQLVEE